MYNLKLGQNNNRHGCYQHSSIVRNVSLGTRIMPCREEFHDTSFQILRYKIDLPILDTENKPYLYLEGIGC